MDDERRRYADEVGLLSSRMGMPPAYGKLLGWLLICDPPAQSSTDLAAALGLSKGSISTGMRMLERSGLVRRVVLPGRNGHAYEMLPDAMITATMGAIPHYKLMAELMARGVEVIGDNTAEQAQRLRVTREFFDFLAEKLPDLIADFKRANNL
jgi:DNA-binding transcriptional regulator GbsR (MarR family)